MPGVFRLLLGVMLLSWSAAGGSPAAAGVCDVVYFHEADCPDCARVERTILPKLVERYGERLRMHRRDVGETRHFEAMMGFELHYGLKPQEVPEFYTSHGVAWDPKKLAVELPALIERSLSGPGPHAEFLEGYLRTGGTGISVAEVVAGRRDVPPARPLVVHEFHKAGCRSCGRVSQSLRYLAAKHPGLVEVRVHAAGAPEAQALLQALCLHHRVPERLHLATPAVFYGDRALVGEAAFKGHDLVAEIVGHLHGPHAMTYEPTEAELALAAETIRGRFKRMAWPAVLLAGLLDGVNPCAFVTVVFLISYLAARKYRRRDALLVGAAFTAAVFATYLLVGLGLMKGAGSIQDIPLLGAGVRWLGAGLAAVVGVLNLRDAWRIRRGSLADMDLKLADGLRRRINEVIRRQVRVRHFVLGAMAIGVAVSVLELACTGQVYLPTILFMLEAGGPQGRALALLVGYNLAFIAPLVAVFTLHAWGTTDRAMSGWLARNGAWIKLGTGALFLGLAAMIAAG